MPAMIRPKGKARKIAWGILGVPQNIMSAKKNKSKSKRSTIIENQYTRYMRGGA